MKIKTSELTGAALNWAVAKCEDFNDGCAIIRLWNNRVAKIIPGDYETSEVYTSYSPSTDWSQGGPIIDLEEILVGPSPFLSGDCAAGIGSDWDTCNHIQTGPTPLIAAMRCYVASKLGDEIEIPEELL
jgi:hypothetical protein